MNVTKALIPCLGLWLLTAAHAQSTPAPVPLIRLFNKKARCHTYTASTRERDELVATGRYELQGTAGKIFLQEVKDTVPVYRMSSDNDEIYTTNSEERAQLKKQNFRQLVLVGYVYEKKQPGTVALKVLYNQSETDHIYTIDEKEVDQTLHRPELRYAGIMGYVIP